MVPRGGYVCPQCDKSMLIANMVPLVIWCREHGYVNLDDVTDWRRYTFAAYVGRRIDEWVNAMAHYDLSNWYRV